MLIREFRPLLPSSSPPFRKGPKGHPLRSENEGIALQGFDMCQKGGDRADPFPPPRPGPPSAPAKGSRALSKLQVGREAGLVARVWYVSTKERGLLWGGVPLTSSVLWSNPKSTLNWVPC